MISRGAATHQYLLAFRQARAPLFAVVPRREMHTHQLTATQDNNANVYMYECFLAFSLFEYILLSVFSLLLINTLYIWPQL